MGLEGNGELLEGWDVMATSMWKVQRVHGGRRRQGRIQWVVRGSVGSDQAWGTMDGAEHGEYVG